ncbi:MAG TPA: DeoR/GlpR family DNA-binding transcription regulator [Blastocatellia bacterium]|nr:DeoR/GlpR family DNA-binding transcription regulator [Blastocatellia bacterium]
MRGDSSAPSDRFELILQELLRNGEVSVDVLAQELKVSAATIRRDLTELERQGLLRRNHGGAAPVAPMLYEAFRHVSSFQEQGQICAAEKRRIGLMAAGLIADGSIIAIGAGTTTTQVARSIRHRKGITVLTNAVNIAMELSHLPDIKVCMTGGSLSGDWFALVGDMAHRSVAEMFVDKAFVGVDGVHAEHGLTTNYPDQAAIHRLMMKQARQRIVVADHRKIGVIGTSLIWPTSEIDVLVTDKATADESVAAFAERKITVLRA